MAAVLGVAVIIGCVCGLIILSTAADDDNIISIGEIYDNPTNVQALYNALAGDGATYEQIKTLAGQTKNAADFREQNGKGINVIFGGQEWEIVYLSTTMDGRPILTLAWPGKASFTTSVWNSFRNDRTYEVYPSDMYGTSYIRTKVLNNAGGYSTDGGRTLNNLVTPDPSHPLAKFTVPSVTGSVTDVIVKPSQVEWQRTGQIGSTYHKFNHKNENWGEEPSTGWCTYFDNESYPDNYSNNYSKIDHYGDWQDDYLWLPSVTECKVIWQTHDMDYDFTYQHLWTRSGSNSYHAFPGEYPNYTYNNLVDQERNLYPALHLDLSAPELCVHKYGAWEYVSTDADGMIHQQRVCQKCGRVGEQRTVYPTLHHITITGDVSGNREQLTINFYSTRVEVIPDLLTFIQLLNDANSGVFVVVDGSNVRYNEPGQGRREYPVTAVVASSTANTFGYCYLNDNGNTVTVWRNLTERIEITDSEMANPDAA